MNIMTKTDIVRARIASKTKSDAEKILKRLGVSHSTFINMSYRAVIEEGGIPYSLHIPNKKTAKVLKDARNPVKRDTYETFDSSEDMFRKLGLKK
jgi:addiction module RelB/DinJ family antitoxin